MAAIRPYLEETHREDPVEAPAENTQADTEAFSGLTKLPTAYEMRNQGATARAGGWLAYWQEQDKVYVLRPDDEKDHTFDSTELTSYADVVKLLRKAERGEPVQLDGRLGDFGIIQGAPPLESSHAELTRTHFIRKTLEDALIDQRYWIERRQGAAEAPGLDGFGDAPVHYGMFALGAPSGPRKRPKAQTADDGRDKTGELVFKLSPGIPNDIVPWYIGAIPLVDTVSFFGSNGKMKCPTWDLPAGSPQIGGACPGALQAQTVVPPAERKKLLVADGKHWRLPVLPPGADEAPIIREAECICQLCYAMEGNYPSPHVQIGELVRYWWSRDLIAAAPERWIETMVEAVLALDIEEMNEIEPIRIHSSGDFFAPAYAEAWMEVANRVHAKRPKIRFWAPTRTWAAPKWLELWPRLLKANTAKNFIVRPSAYMIGDPAPGSLAPHRGMGSTSIFNGEILGMKKEFEAVIAEGRRAQYEANRAAAPGEKKDPRFDWDCQTYAVALEGRGDLSKSCADAIGPDGKRGCRACWTHPELRVNYTTH